MTQDRLRGSGSTLPLEPPSSGRDSTGTPTPNPRRFEDNNRPAISKAKTQEHNSSESIAKIRHWPQSIQSSLSSHGADGTDGEHPMPLSALEDPATFDGSADFVTNAYDQYDLDGFTPQDFGMLLTLAPTDQLPDPTTSEVKVDRASGLPDRRSAIHTAIKRYVIFHKFNQDRHASHTISQRRAFERNVYDYARANGFGKKEALSEVRKARVLGGAPDDDSEGSSFGPEVDDTSEILAHLAKTTFSYRDIEMESINAVRTYEPQVPKRVNTDRKQTRRTKKAGREKHNVTETRKAVSNANFDRKGASGNADMEPAKSHAAEVPSSTGSAQVDEKPNGRRKRKRTDVEAAGYTTRETKKSKYFEQLNREQSTFRQSRYRRLESNESLMELDVPREKDADKGQTTPTVPKITEKATKRREKRNRRREKHAAESEQRLHSETRNFDEDQTLGVELPSAKVIDAKPSNAERLTPAETKKRNRRKRKARDSESRIDVGPSSSRPEHQTSSKELGPNDPKSEQEAHQNFLRANEHDPQESTLTADQPPRELPDAEGKQSKFIEKLDALKRFSDENQLQLYDDGKYSNADKQTKEDLKDLKEEKTSMEEMDIATRKANKGPERKEERKSRRSTVKPDKVTMDEIGGGGERGEVGKVSGARVKKRKKAAEKQEDLSPHAQAGFQ